MKPDPTPDIDHESNIPPLDDTEFNVLYKKKMC